MPDGGEEWGVEFGMVSIEAVKFDFFFGRRRGEIRHFSGTDGTYTQRTLPLLPSSLVREEVLRDLRWRSGA